MYNKERIFQLIDQALALTQGHPALVQVTSSAEGLSRIANSEIHQNVFEDRTSLSVTIYDSKKSSSISTTLLSQEGIAEAVQEAIANLALLPEGEEQQPLISEPKEMETLRFSLELHEAFGVETRVQMIADGFKGIPDNYKAYGQLAYRATNTGMGNSAGIRRYSDDNSVRFSLLVSDDVGGTGYASMVASTPEEVDLASVFAIALQKAQANQDPIELEPGAYTVILEPMAVSNLLGSLMFSFSGAALVSKMSFLTDRLGEQLFSEKLTIVDDWTNPLSPGIAFDSEGVPRSKLTLVDKGVTKEVAWDRAAAAKAGAQTTGHALSFMGRSASAPMNTVITPGEKPLAQIIAETTKALLVTRFHYMNPVNARQALLTGITRDGFFLVENGKITKAVRNMRFTESMLKAFSQIEEIASDGERLGAMMGSSYVPGMKITDFHFTGKTSFTDT
ncbi:MAG: TldD/PmbA family protein [Symbiobacteriaceae bacterium]|nr:TldD/PmbA family protein [Symbiobacteriaceae bacterium]